MSRKSIIELFEANLEYLNLLKTLKVPSEIDSGYESIYPLLEKQFDEIINIVNGGKNYVKYCLRIKEFEENEETPNPMDNKSTEKTHSSNTRHKKREHIRKEKRNKHRGYKKGGVRNDFAKKRQNQRTTKKK